MDLDKELEKLADLEFEYNIARISKQKEEIIENAKKEYIKQIRKISRLKKGVKNADTEQK